VSGFRLSCYFKVSRGGSEMSQGQIIPEGTRVRLKRDPGRQGIATAESLSISGKLHQYVLTDGGGKKAFPVFELEILPDETDPIGDLRRGQLGVTADLAQRLTDIRLRGRLSDLIYSMDTTNTEFYAYQFKPVVKILNANSSGLLIADEVGLGKTIEAGLVWTELAARYDLKRLLIVCPKSLQAKWRSELSSKFGVRSQIANAQEVLDALNDPATRSDGFALVASLSALRPPKSWDDEGEDVYKSARAKLARVLSEEADGEPLFDLVIIDEAHHLRNSNTSQSELGRMLCAASEYKLLLSATPINLKSEDLRVLLSLLEPDLFEKEWIFQQLESENRPLIEARNRALSSTTTLEELKEYIAQMPRPQLLETGGRLEDLEKKLFATTDELTPYSRAQIASKLEEMSLLGSVINRTRRRDVQKDQVKRRASVRRWVMSEIERAVYDQVSQIIREYASGGVEGFLLSMPQRLMASSMPAAIEHWQSQPTQLGLDEELDDDEYLSGPLVARLSEFANNFRALDELKSNDSKKHLLIQALEQTWDQFPEEKLIVFSSFRRTIDYLAEELRRFGVAVFGMHGSSAKPREITLAEFEAYIGPAILLTSEIGGEGLDLQFCARLINYDLPWNPMKVEQRIGRIDRIGQTSETIEIISLICSGTVEDRIYERLYERLKIIEQTLGGFESILGEQIYGLERRLLDPKMTADEQDAEISRAAQQIENRKIDEETLEKEAGGLIAHGDLILERINRAHEQQHKVGNHELHRYLDETLRSEFPGSGIQRATTSEQIFEVSLSWDARAAFTGFLNQHAKRVQTEFRRNTEAVLVSFERVETAKGARSKPELLTWSHPLVRFCSELRKRSYPDGMAPIAVASRLNALPSNVPTGKYAIRIEHWGVSGFTEKEVIETCVAALSNPSLVLGETEANALLSAWLLNEGSEIDPTIAELTAAADQIEGPLQEILRSRWEDWLNYESANFSDRKATRIQVLQRQINERSFKSEMEILKLQREGKFKTIPARQGKFARFEATVRQRIQKIDSDLTFEFSDRKIVAVGLIEVA